MVVFGFLEFVTTFDKKSPVHFDQQKINAALYGNTVILLPGGMRLPVKVKYTLLRTVNGQEIVGLVYCVLS
jgi:hypothetical protein